MISQLAPPSSRTLMYSWIDFTILPGTSCNNVSQSCRQFCQNDRVVTFCRNSSDIVDRQRLWTFASDCPVRPCTICSTSFPDLTLHGFTHITPFDSDIILLVPDPVKMAKRSSTTKTHVCN